jgi:hypothetical protein
MLSISRNDIIFQKPYKYSYDEIVSFLIGHYFISINAIATRMQIMCFFMVCLSAFLREDGYPGVVARSSGTA